MPKYQSIDRTLYQCSGDCGNYVAKFIECAVKDKNCLDEHSKFIKLVETEFSDYHNPVRKEFVELLNSNCDNRSLYTSYHDLNNKNYHPKSVTQLRKIALFIHQLAKDGYHDILQQVGNVSCCVRPRPLWREITENLNAIRQRKRNELQNQLNAINMVISQYYNTQLNCEHIPPMLNGLNIEKKKLLSQINKADGDLAKLPAFNKQYYEKRMIELKNNPELNKMKQKGLELSDLEIIALLLYCDNDLYCYEMRKSQRNKRESCKWKTLYSYICAAVDKMHRTFYHKNKKQKRKMYLFHGNTIPYLSDEQQEQLILNTVTSFSCDYSVAKDFSQRLRQNSSDPNGMILVIEDAHKLLCEGTLRGADVSWISRHKEKEFIILPTTFYNFKMVCKSERLEKGWIVVDDHSMYITFHCISDQHSYANINKLKTYNSQMLKRHLTHTKDLLIPQLSDKQKQLNELHSQFNQLEHKISVEQQKIDKFKIERNDPSMKLIVVIGGTGSGKSTLCNRMMGDESKEGHDGPFNANDAIWSVTQEIRMKTTEINNLKITVVDTPGLGDTGGNERDRKHKNDICEFLKGCGGINAFILVVNGTHVRFDSTFKKLLHMYYSMLGDAFFEGLIIVATRVEGMFKKIYTQRKQDCALRNAICKQFDLNIDIPVIPIGMDNYRISILELKRIIPSDKCICQKLKSPIDEMKLSYEMTKNEQNALKKIIGNIKNQINSIDRSLNSL
eukprot:237868_1